MAKNVWILGSTGSIGTQALDVIRDHRDEYSIAGLGAGGAHPSLLAQQAAEFAVPVVALADEKAVPEFRNEYIDACSRMGAGTMLSEPQILTGANAMVQLVQLAQGDTVSPLNVRDSIQEKGLHNSHASLAASSCSAHDVSVPDVVLNGITGSVGLKPTLAALHTGATLALANKESLVAGGMLVRDAMKRPGQIVPVDSEHCAIFQSVQAGIHHKGLTNENVDGQSNVRRIILTASGGPFRGRSRSELHDVSLEQALAHPTWNMGPVVTINSATLMNKGLELIEAAYLFDMNPADIVPVIHPQSAIHSMVEFIDGSTLAQASPPDMRLPIALGLSWPERILEASPSFDWLQAMNWTFEPLDNEAFPAVQMARDAAAASALHPAVMNAANEEAVAAFASGELSFLGITDTVRDVLNKFDAEAVCGKLSSAASSAGLYSVDAVTEAEAWARAMAHQLMRQQV